MLAMLLAASLAAPVPKVKVPELYFPTVVGKKVMKVTLRGETGETTQTVKKVEEKNGTYTVTVIDDPNGLEFGYEVSAMGVVMVSNPTAKDDEPCALLKLPAKEGDTWTNPTSGPGKDDKATHTIGKEVKVEVPAGKFKAIVVTTELKLNGRVPIKATTWYAVGVGVVKKVTDGLGDVRTEELKEFTPGK